MFSNAVPTVHKSPGEFEIVGCIHCFIFGELFIVADACDGCCKFKHRLTFQPTRHCRHIRFFVEESFTHLELAWSQLIESSFVTQFVHFFLVLMLKFYNM